MHKCVYLSTSVLLQLEGEKTLWFSANRWLMESNQSLYLKKGIQFSVFGAHSSGLICNPVCSGPDLLTPSLYSPLDWGTTYISLERHKMSLEMISGFETSVSVDFNWTQVFVFDVCGRVLCLGLWVCVRVLYSCIYIIMLTQLLGCPGNHCLHIVHARAHFCDLQTHLKYLCMCSDICCFPWLCLNLNEFEF